MSTIPLRSGMYGILAMPIVYLINDLDDAFCVVAPFASRTSWIKSINAHSMLPVNSRR